MVYFKLISVSLVATVMVACYAAPLDKNLDRESELQHERLVARNPSQSGYVPISDREKRQIVAPVPLGGSLTGQRVPDDSSEETIRGIGNREFSNAPTFRRERRQILGGPAVGPALGTPIVGPFGGSSIQGPLNGQSGIVERERVVSGSERLGNRDGDVVDRERLSDNNNEHLESGTTRRIIHPPFPVNEREKRQILDGGLGGGSTIERERVIDDGNDNIGGGMGGGFNRGGLGGGDVVERERVVERPGVLGLGL